MRVFFLVVLILSRFSSAARSFEMEKPNFVVINIDDLGYADIGPFGSKKNRTPHLDRMAREGRKLTSFYAAPVCSPSRAALMTGCYAKRVLPIPGVLFPGNAMGLSPNEVTVAEMLREVGYATAIIGKWHLGDQPELLPNQQGFDLHFGLPYSNDMGPAADGIKSNLGAPLPKEAKAKQPPLPLLRNGAVVKRVLPDDQQSLVQLYTDEAKRFIEANRSKPFLLYLPHSAVHFPLYPGKEWVGKSPHGLFSDWVEEVDASIGSILDTLRDSGLAAKTFVLFTSDNGGTPRSENQPLRGNKTHTWEGGMRVPTIAWWPGKIPADSQTDAIAGMLDVMPTLAHLSGGQIPQDRKIDGVNLWPILSGSGDHSKPPRDTFLYFQGLQLQAIRHKDWKLFVEAPRDLGRNLDKADKEFSPMLFDLKLDLSESHDVASMHPEVVARLEKMVQAVEQDLGRLEKGPGCRELGVVLHPKPILPFDAE
jgi:arylsulfatase A